MSLFYIKSQHKVSALLSGASCFMSLFYIKSQLISTAGTASQGCFMSLFYIKSQLMPQTHVSLRVVLCLCSTSNHNDVLLYPKGLYVVLCLCSTSNHNCVRECARGRGLFYVSVLHQITTFYQPEYDHLGVVLCLCSTSNHNRHTSRHCCRQLFYVSVLHQITTFHASFDVSRGCFMSLFYIKSQLLVAIVESGFGCFMSLFYIKSQLINLRTCVGIVVLCLCSTSNHNVYLLFTCLSVIYVIQHNT